MQYDAFAPYYDSFAVANSAEIIKEIADQYFPSAKTLLDVACGTGNDILELQKRFSCTGIDISRNMLKIASTKVNSELHQKDMRDFNLNQTFDIIICMFDSINHLPTAEDINKCFNSIKKHMHKDSVFIFDINTYSYLESLGQGYEFLLENGIEMSLIPYENCIVWQARKSNQLLEEIKEYFYSLDTLKQIASGHFTFELVDENKQPPTEKSHRVYFICQNP